MMEEAWTWEVWRTCSAQPRAQAMAVVAALRGGA
jgi:hypothetical protein